MDELTFPWPGRFVTEEGRPAEIAERLAASAPLAFRVAYSVLRHREDAEDVAQEALATALTRYGDLEDHDRFEAWLVRIAWRRALDRRRAEARQRRREQRADLPEAGLDAEQLAAARQRDERIWAEVDRLPEDLRLVVTLFFIEERQVAEVARLLQVPAGTVKSRLFRARRTLAERLR